MSLSVAEQFYVSCHRDVAPKELAKTIGVRVAVIRATLKELPPVEAKPELPKPSGFSVYKGVTSMTPNQAADDDDINRRAPQSLVGTPGIFVIDPSKPVR